MMRITKTSSSSSSSSSSRRRSASLSSVAETASMAHRPLPPLPSCDQRPNHRPLPPLPDNQRSLPPIPAATCHSADSPALVIAKLSTTSHGSPTSTARVVDSRANGTSLTLTTSTCSRKSRSFATADDIATLRRLRGDGGKPQLPPRPNALTPSPCFNYDKGMPTLYWIAPEKNLQGGPKKLHTAFFAFAYSRPIFIIFGLYKPQEICNWKVYS